MLKFSCYRASLWLFKVGSSLSVKKTHAALQLVTNSMFTPLVTMIKNFISGFLTGPCARPAAPTNGKIVHNAFRHGETVTFACNKGYKLRGPSQRFCNYGAWSETHIQTTCQGDVLLL